MLKPRLRKSCCATSRRRHHELKPIQTKRQTRYEPRTKPYRSCHVEIFEKGTCFEKGGNSHLPRAGRPLQKRSPDTTPFLLYCHFQTLRHNDCLLVLSYASKSSYAFLTSSACHAACRASVCWECRNLGMYTTQQAALRRL